MKKMLLIFLLQLVLYSTYSQISNTVNLFKYTQKDGLPSYNVRKVIQDTKGFIWLGTQDGLSRFDGNRFLNYSKSSGLKNKICGVDVRAIIEDSVRQLIWVLPAEVGINAINANTNEVVLTAPIPDSGPEDWNISMIMHEDELWIGTSTGVKIYNIKTNAYEPPLVLPEKPTTSTTFETRSVYSDEYGNIWACYSGYGIVIYSGVTKKIIQQIPLKRLNDHTKSKDMRFSGYSSISTGQVLFATSQGLRKIDYSKSYTLVINNTPCESYSPFNTENIEYIGKNNAGELYISGFSKFVKFKSTLTDPVFFEEPPRTAETDWLNAVQCTLFDDYNNIWLGCQEGLAFISARGNPFKPFVYNKATNIKLDHVRSIFTSGNGTILTGLRNGLVEINERNSFFKKYDTGHLYHHIFQDRKGVIHVSRPDGMFTFNNGVITPLDHTYKEFAPYKTIPINSHLLISDSLVVLGTESSNGILVWNPLKKTVRSIENGQNNGLLSSSIVNNIYRDSKGNIWVLSDNIIHTFSPDLQTSSTIKPFDKQSNMPYKLFFDMCEINSQYWITSYGSGVIIIDSSGKVIKTLSTADGLSNDGVYQIFGINKHQVVVTTNNGLNLIDTRHNQIRKYSISDGLHSNSFEEVAGMVNNKTIYTGGLNGFTVIEADLFSNNNSKPLLYFGKSMVKTSLTLIDTSDFRINKLFIPQNTIEAFVTFSAINPLNPGNTLIYYNIEERGESWSVLQNNSLPLIGFNHGTYHLKLKAVNEDGIESDIKTLTLIIEPKWYQTWLFKTFVGLAIFALIFSFYRLRINQLKKEQRIRTKLASDLHDDLGSTLNSVKLYANLATMEYPAGKYTPLIAESTQEAITSIRDMIWVLDDRKDTVDDLLLRVSNFATPLCEATSVKYIQDISNAVRAAKLAGDEKRNLYMMLKESINNAIKYAGSPVITVTAYLQKNKPVFTISDQGKGFAATNENAGNGLKNLAIRATAIHYLLSIDSTPGNGTRIRIEKK